MAFLKRLGWYLVGLSIGIVFLTLFLKKKSDETGAEFCYFPNCRVLKDIRSKELTYSDAIQELMQNNTLDSLSIAHFLNDGDIDFGSSDRKSSPCKTYLIEGIIKDKAATLTIKNCTSKAIIEKLEMR